MASRPREQAVVTAAILGRRAPVAAGRGEGQREHRWDHTHPWDCSVAALEGLQEREQRRQ